MLSIYVMNTVMGCEWLHVKRDNHRINSISLYDKSIVCVCVLISYLQQCSIYYYEQIEAMHVLAFIIYLRSLVLCHITPLPSDRHTGEPVTSSGIL